MLILMDNHLRLVCNDAYSVHSLGGTRTGYDLYSKIQGFTCTTAVQMWGKASGLLESAC